MHIKVLRPFHNFIISTLLSPLHISFIITKWINLLLFTCSMRQNMIITPSSKRTWVKMLVKSYLYSVFNEKLQVQFLQTQGKVGQSAPGLLCLSSSSKKREKMRMGYGFIAPGSRDFPVFLHHRVEVSSLFPTPSPPDCCDRSWRSNWSHYKF